MKQYYECHVTMMGTPERLKPLVEELRWKFSAIDGDPTLGDGIKCYATRHYNARHGADEIIKQVNLVADALMLSAVDVIRRKVELVIYDSKQETVDPKVMEDVA